MTYFRHSFVNKMDAALISFYELVFVLMIKISMQNRDLIIIISPNAACLIITIQEFRCPPSSSPSNQRIATIIIIIIICMKKP